MRSSEDAAIRRRPAYDYMFKFTVLGKSASGKTALIERYADAFFSQEHHSMDAEFNIRTIEVDQRVVKTQVFEHPGFEVARYQNVTRMYRNVNVFMITVDLILSEEAIKNDISDCLHSVAHYGPENAITFIVGTKLDLLPQSRRPQAMENLKRSARAAFDSYPDLIRSECFITSASNDIGVDEVFKRAVVVTIFQMIEGGVRRKIQARLSKEVESIKTFLSPFFSVFRSEAGIRRSQDKLEALETLIRDLDSSVNIGRLADDILTSAFHSNLALASEAGLGIELLELCESAYPREGIGRSDALASSSGLQVNDPSRESSPVESVPVVSAAASSNASAASAAASSNPSVASARSRQAVPAGFFNSSANRLGLGVQYQVFSNLPTNLEYSHGRRSDLSVPVRPSRAQAASKEIEALQSYLDSVKADPIGYDTLSVSELSDLEKQCKEFRCPISLCLPVTPVQLVAGDSEIFDYESVKKLPGFGAGQITHPITRATVKVDSIFPCRFAANTLRRSCKEMVEKREKDHVSMAP